MYEESLDKEEAINAARGKLDYTAIWISLRHWGDGPGYFTLITSLLL